jgi:hypothetical protein
MKDFIVFGDLGRTDLLFLSTKGRTRGLQFLLLLCVDRRVSEVEFLYRFHNGRGDKKSGKPLLSAGTTYHGARFDAVARIASSNACM